MQQYQESAQVSIPRLVKILYEIGTHFQAEQCLTKEQFHRIVKTELSK